MEIYRSTS